MTNNDKYTDRNKVHVYRQPPQGPTSTLELLMCVPALL